MKRTLHTLRFKGLLLNGERQGDLIQSFAYAPTLGASQAPKMVLLSFDHDIINYSTSFYVQKLLAMHKSTTVYQTTGPFDPLYYVASSNGAKYYIKVANPYPGSVTLTAQYSISSFTPSNASAIGIFGEKPDLQNQFDNSTKISPQSIPVTLEGQNVHLTIPSYGTVFVTLFNGSSTPNSTSDSNSGSSMQPITRPIASATVLVSKGVQQISDGQMQQPTKGA